MSEKLKTAKILIVDDSIVARMGIKRMLEGEVAAMDEASNGSEALEKLKANSYDCILMDYLMPGLNGMVTLKIIKQKGIQTPVIIISANQQEATIAKFYEIGVDMMMKKHVQKQELIANIEKVLSSRESK